MEGLMNLYDAGVKLVLKMAQFSGVRILRVKSFKCIYSLKFQGGTPKNPKPSSE